MIVFISIFGVGFSILILSVIFGADSDIDSDMDAGVEGPSIFSIKLISLLMIGFGAVGFGCMATTDMTMFQSSLAGVGGAAAVGAVGYMIIRLFYTSQASSTIRNQDLIGKTANVIDAIEKNQNGQIACVMLGREITFLARSIDGLSIKRGEQVEIVSRAGNVITVKKIEE